MKLIISRRDERHMALLTFAFYHHIHSAYDESSKGTWSKLLIFRVDRIIKVVLENTEEYGTRRSKSQGESAIFFFTTIPIEP